MLTSYTGHQQRYGRYQPFSAHILLCRRDLPRHDDPLGASRRVENGSHGKYDAVQMQAVAKVVVLLTNSKVRIYMGHDI